MGPVARTKENVGKCSCMQCPSYKLGCKMKAMPKNMLTMLKGNIGELDHFEGMFCAFDKSDCITEITECICETCEVFKENDLPNYGYCTVTGGLKSHVS
jgi:hypothetical protein